jgi:riboflavin synthase
MEVYLEKVKEPTSVKVKSVAVHEEAHKEDATVKPVMALRKRHRDRNLPIRRRKKPKEQTQANGGYLRKLAAARRGMTHHAGVE